MILKVDIRALGIRKMGIFVEARLDRGLSDDVVSSNP